MFENRRISATLLMGGAGLRFGGEVPKQFHLLNGEEIYRYALDTMIDSHFFEEIILVCHPDWMNIPDLPDHIKIVPGGADRQESSLIGLRSFEAKPDIVLIHDAVRPFVTQEILRANILGAIQHGAVNTCIPSTDTLIYSPDGKEVESIPDRNFLLRGQTPQTFSYTTILEAHQKAIEDGVHNATDDCQLVLRLGKKVFLIPGDRDNRKITTEFDLKLAEILLNPMLLPK